MFAYAAVLSTKVVALVMLLTAAFAAKQFAAKLTLVPAEAVELADMVNCVVLSMVRMRVLFGMPVLPVRNMPALNVDVSATVTWFTVAPIVPLK